MADYVLPDEALDFQGGNGGERFCLGPLGEVINGNHRKLCLPLAFRKWANYVDAQLRKRPWAANMSHQLCGQVLDIRKPLALVTFPDQLFSVL